MNILVPKHTDNSSNKKVEEYKNIHSDKRRGRLKFYGYENNGNGYSS